MTWREFLGGFTAGVDAPLDDAFADGRGAAELVVSVPDQEAAAKFHVQLISRVSTQRLPYLAGVEGTALDSVYKLFEHARQICMAHPAARDAEAIIWHVLNTHVRPFTAKWHPVKERGQLKALDTTDEFRAELEVLQGRLRRFATLLARLAQGEAQVRHAPANDDHARMEELRAEMRAPLAWGIPTVQGGIDNPKVVEQINGAEKEAITKRRAWYGLPQHKPDAAGLALSGGGIRSATFALGVLVALARRGLLPQFDYLSTVSGGGFLGSFLTCLMNSRAEPPPAGQRIGLCREQLPFCRPQGESEPIRHLRHFSKYLAAGSLSERLQMAGAQIYGMFVSTLGLVFLLAVLALSELLARRLGFDRIWPILMGIAGGAMVVSAVLGAWLLRGGRGGQRVADRLLMGCGLITLALALWPALTRAHDWAGAPDRLHVRRAATVTVAGAAILVATSALAGVGARTAAWMRVALAVLSMLAAPVFIFGLYLVAYEVLEHARGGAVIVLGAIAAAGGLTCCLLNVNFTSPHRHYRDRLSEAYLLQYAGADGATTLRRKDDLKLSEATSDRAPYHLINAALNVPASKERRVQGRLTDFFLFSPNFCGSPLTGYHSTAKWEDLDPHLDLGTAMAISGAAAAPHMGLGTRRRLSFWMALLNVRMAYWLRNPLDQTRVFGNVPGLTFLLREMFGRIDEKQPWLYVSDGGHIENLGIYELLRRRCKFIVAVDGEQDERMTFGAITTLQRLAAIDLGVTIDINLDDLRRNDGGLSRSHFRFCRVEYPEGCCGYLLYLKLSLTGNEGEFLRRYRLDEPAFPHHSTADQFFSEAQFEAYRSLGEHVGEKLFLPSLVGINLAAVPRDVALEHWFEELGSRLLDPRAR